ncbi:MAG: hypothetical protein QOE98_1315, partial [Gaiellaceae bacterium]|nr:hypothetical protein [Gaiellaceae bacterium]
MKRAWGSIRSHPTAADAALTATLFGAALVSSQVELDNMPPDGPLHRSPSTAALVAAVAVVVAPLVLRRRFPLSVLVACTAGLVLSRVALDAGDGTIT